MPPLREFRFARAGRYAEAMPLYQRFMPLLHLDARPDLVQCIKLCKHIMGRGTALTRQRAWRCCRTKRPRSKR